jgi:guanosine-3',5'-bis(diphosphate) 3'-pyrophosphohydrolase
MILKAIRFAEEKHQTQTRKSSGHPYMVHPLIGSYLVGMFKQSKHISELIVAFILHDTLEDTDTTFHELASEFTPLVASIVGELTSNEEQLKLIGKNEYLKKKMVGISSWALVLKLVDRLINICDSPKLQYVTDTIDLMEHLKSNRILTVPQKTLVDEISNECHKIINQP